MSLPQGSPSPDERRAPPPPPPPKKEQAEELVVDASDSQDVQEQRPKGIFEEFQEQLHSRADSIAMMLPLTVTRGVFIEVVQAAVRANPSLLNYDRRSFFAACVKAAKDGLLPDGKEGALVPRKKKGGGMEIGWQPMAWGIRKRARQTDGLILDAQVVRQNDLWKRQQGDDARIIHEPLDEWKGKRGDLVAVYLIVRQPSPHGETILHREVMYRSDVMAVKSVSKQQDADHWTKFEEEGWKKSAIHRGMKSVPCSDALREVLSRDYDDFEYSSDRTPPAPKAAPRMPPPPPPPRVQSAPVPKQLKPPAPPTPTQDPPAVQEEEAPPAPNPAWQAETIADITAAINKTKTRAAVKSLEEKYTPLLMQLDADGRETIIEIIEARKASLKG